MTKVRVSTSAYQFAHGKIPKGYGCWAFFFDGERDVSKAQFFSGSYSEAKRAAVAFAVAHNHTDVSVGS